MPRVSTTDPKIPDRADVEFITSTAIKHAGDSAAFKRDCGRPLKVIMGPWLHGGRRSTSPAMPISDHRRRFRQCHDLMGQFPPPLVRSLAERRRQRRRAQAAGASVPDGQRQRQQAAKAAVSIMAANGSRRRTAHAGDTRRDLVSARQRQADDGEADRRRRTAVL